MYFPQIEKSVATKKNVIKSYNDEEQEQFLNKGYDVVNPLKSKGEYFNIKSGQNEIVELLEHQERFLRKFFQSNVTGSIVFHGVGTGKSLTKEVDKDIKKYVDAILLCQTILIQTF